MIHENNTDNQPKKKGCLWWFLMILIFPISLSVWFYKTDKIKLKKSWKILIIATIWIIIFICSKTSPGTTQTEHTNSSDKATAKKDISEPSSVNSNQASEPNEGKTESSETVEQDEFHIIDTFIEKYNAAATTPMTEPVVIDINDKSSEHYRTEYRTLNNALAKQCQIGDATIDIISTTDFLSGSNIRIYLHTESIDFAAEVFDIIARLVYPEITDNELSDAHNKLKQDSSSSLNDITFYYIQSYNELFMNNVMYAE